jgi:DNA polymerase I-like protein with 3'-5' exonuclease and polymerase domains
MLCNLVNGRESLGPDEILLEVPIEATDEVALILKETMEGAGRAFLKILPV